MLSCEHNLTQIIHETLSVVTYGVNNLWFKGEDFMKKRINVFFMVLLLGVLSVIMPLSEVVPVAAASLTVKLHYHRKDGKYEGWNVWMWDEGGDGKAYDFNKEGKDMVATKDVALGAAKVGFIIRKGEWEEKDFDGDQFIDLSDMVSGTVDVFVESGKEGFEKKNSKDAVTGIKVSQAKYNGDVNIAVTMTGKVKEDLMKAFKIKPEVKIKAVEEGSDNLYSIILDKALDAGGNYSIIYDKNEYKIIMPNFYSTQKFEEEYTYTGDDLGAVWTKDKTVFKVWAPTAKSVKINLYKSGTVGTDDLIETIDMKSDINGTWIAEKQGDLNGVYYTYTVEVNGKKSETCDPYARTTGVNGDRAMIIDLSSTNPDGWDSDTDPNSGKNITDATIYEIHIRDLSSDKSSGIKNVGKFLGLTETGTKTSSGIPTGLDHIKDLGITHLHILPFYDYGSVDETKLDKPQFNWGYDPKNYNVPEGSYSTDPYKGEVRVKEAKQMIQTLHKNGISVVMDVVYNHVHNAGDFCFNVLVPGYFSRISSDGKYSNGSGCGNDTASERSMVKKYIVDSVLYWADEYHIDGFRFDLVGLIDTDTINEVVEKVHEKHPNVIFYGEGWTMQTDVTKGGYAMTTQAYSTKTPKFAFFSDTIRDLLKGSVFSGTEPGYVTGAIDQEEKLTNCWMGAAPWCKTPSQTVNYASCHDNNTLFDRITMTLPKVSEADRIKMNNLAAAIYMTAEGIPFMQAGEEMLRTKDKGDGTYEHNSYSSPDSINSIKWDTLDNEVYKDVFKYYKGLIAFRKEHSVLRFTNPDDVKNNITPVEGLEKNVVAFNIKGGINDGLFVIFNPNNHETKVNLPESYWNICINDKKAGTDVIETVTGEVKVAPISAMVLVKSDVKSSTEAETGSKDISSVVDNETKNETSSNNDGGNRNLFIILGIVVVLGIIVVSLNRKNKK